MKILNRYTDKLIYENNDTDSIRETVEEAVKQGIRLHFADLAYADLSEANLNRAALNSANLREANLTRANLIEAGLRRADLSCADLREIDLCGADLTDANLSNANLESAKLYAATLYGAKGIISIGPIGNEDRIIYAYRYNNEVYVMAGCFNGTLEEFANVVIDKYGDNRAEYNAAITLIQAKFGKEK